MRRGLESAWTRVCAIVAQPGVEFGDQNVHAYDRAGATALCGAAREIPGIVLEGHSTDYQTTHHLRQLVEDGVGILKVGPALTFALRECLFSLELIEQELMTDESPERLSNLSACLEEAMLAYPAHWSGYYSGTEAEMWRGSPLQLLGPMQILLERSRCKRRGRASPRESVRAHHAASAHQPVSPPSLHSGAGGSADRIPGFHSRRKRPRGARTLLGRRQGRGVKRLCQPQRGLPSATHDP